MAEISKYIQEGGQEKWEEIKAYLADLESQIGDGTITVTNAQNGEEFDASACGNITIK